VAEGKVTATDKREGRVLRETPIHVEETYDIMNLGNGGAVVCNTRGFKKWASTRESGLTVEATVSVTLTCNQDQNTIDQAAALAGGMAEHHAREGITEMNQYFEEL
jgi:hypothetical protein